MGHPVREASCCEAVMCHLKVEMGACHILQLYAKVQRVKSQI